MSNAIRSLLARKPALIMGILNATPDSFSDGGQYHTLKSALTHAKSMIDAGVDIIDVGGESTRPGADAVGLQEELDRVIPIIERLSSEFDVPVSIDTYKPQVMRDAVLAGAQLINDVNGLRSPGAIQVVADCGVPVCIMHMQGGPKEMQHAPDYHDVVDEVIQFFNAQIAECMSAGIAKADILIDPGIGFGKTLEHNLELLKQIPRLSKETGCQVLIGVSRKSLIDMQLGRPVEERLPASLGLGVQSALNGAKILRVHDVRATYDAIRMVEAVQNVEPEKQ